MTQDDDWLSEALMRGAGGLQEIEGGLDGNLGQWAAGRVTRRAATPPPQEPDSWPGQPRRGILGWLRALAG